MENSSWPLANFLFAFNPLYSAFILNRKSSVLVTLF